MSSPALSILAFGAYLQVRNVMVYRFRSRVLEESMRDYDQLPEYDTMMWRFWVWPLEKFRE